MTSATLTMSRIRAGHVPITVVWLLALAIDLLLLINIETSSLWMDELYSAFYSEPAFAFPAIYFERMVIDPHPPLYYLSLYGWRQIFGDSDAALRGFSLLCGLLLQLSIYFGTRAFLSVPTRLALLLLVSLSPVFLFHSIDARSYALLLLIAQLATLQFYALFRERHVDLWGYARLTVLCLLASFTHHYGLLLSGGLVLTLMIAALLPRPRLGEAAAAGLCGALVLVPFALFLLWHMQQIVFDFSQTNFSSEPYFLFYNTVIGLYRPYGRWPALVLILLVAAAFLLMPGKDGARPSPTLRARLLDELAPLWPFLSVIGIVTLSALLISLLWMPSLLLRNFTVVAPAAWLLLAIYCERKLNARPRALIIGLGAMLILLNAWHLPTLFLPSKEEWRASSHFVERQNRCRGAEIPVVAVDRLAGQDRFFYSRYLDDAERFRLVEVPRGALKSSAPAERRQALEVIYEAYEPSCPVLLWTVHMMTRAELEALLAALDPSRLQGVSGFEIRGFPHTASLTLNERRAESFVVLAK